jgi:competence CoiA-like predicted nuclease
MFVAKWKNQTQQDNVLDAQWADAGVFLREAARKGELCCPHYDHEVWLREGERRRRHFAHKQLADCPFQADSEEVSEVKAQLYTWLKFY